MGGIVVNAIKCLRKASAILRVIQFLRYYVQHYTAGFLFISSVNSTACKRGFPIS